MRLLKKDLNIIKEVETFFKIERMPKDLTFFERLSLYHTLRDSVEGVVLKVYKTMDFIVCIYTKKMVSKSSFCIMLLEKVRFLLNLINEPISSEVWILKEGSSYSCIGIFRSIPVFFKSFHSICDIKQNLKEMCDQMNSYLEFGCIRIFNFDQFEFVLDTVDVFEYSSDFIRCRLGHQTSLNEYCIEAYIKQNSTNRFDMFLVILNICIIFLCIVVFSFNNSLRSYIIELKQDLMKID